LEDVDFELSLIHRDYINVAYILNLLASLGKLKPEEAQQRKKEIIELLAGEANLRSKMALIQAFIDNNLPRIQPDEDIVTVFEQFWTAQKIEALHSLCEEEKIKPAELEKLIKNYLFANRLPLGQDIINALEFQPKILERKTIVERIAEKFKLFIDTFVEGMGGIV
jgi:type I restriction enzyme R subunit